MIIKPGLYEETTIEADDVTLEIIRGGEKIGTSIKIVSPWYLQQTAIPGDGLKWDALSVSVVHNVSALKALAPVSEERRIKHIVSELVRRSKKARQESRTHSDRSKNKAVLEGIANALDAMASMIESGEMFRNMPIDEVKEDA